MVARQVCCVRIRGRAMIGCGGNASGWGWGGPGLVARRGRRCNSPGYDGELPSCAATEAVHGAPRRVRQKGPTLQIHKSLCYPPKRVYAMLLQLFAGLSIAKLLSDICDHCLDYSKKMTHVRVYSFYYPFGKLSDGQSKLECCPK